MDGTFNDTERNRRESVYSWAIAKWGTRNQLVVAMEELSELQKEISKLLRGEGNFDHLVEEIADVKIMVEQLEFIYGCKSPVSRIMGEKIKRLEGRLEAD